MFDILDKLNGHFKECFFDDIDFFLPDPPPTAEELISYQKPGDNYFCKPPKCKNNGRPRLPSLQNPKTHEYDIHIKSCRKKCNPDSVLERYQTECPICRQVDNNLYQLKGHLENEHNIRKRN